MYVVLEGLTVNCSIFICLLCYKDKFGQRYTYANCVKGKNVIYIYLCIMLQVTLVVQDEQVSEGLTTGLAPGPSISSSISVPNVSEQAIINVSATTQAITTNLALHPQLQE